MNNLNEDLELGEDLDLRVHPREAETISIQIPKDTLESLRKIAAQRDMSLEALLKFYIGKCLRQDLSQILQQKQVESLLLEGLDSGEPVEATDDWWEQKRV